MKIGNHITLFELQNLLFQQSLTMKVDYTSSAGAWRVMLQSLSSEGRLWTGIGRTIGEALNNAYDKFERGE